VKLAGRVAFAAMSLVTAWSIWAWGQSASGHRADHVSNGTGATQSELTASTAREATAADDTTPPPMNWTRFGEETPPYVAMLINFGILIAGYYYFGKKSISTALQNRRDTISKEIDEAQRMKHEAEERAKIYQAKLRRLEDETRGARDALARSAEAERERILAEAEDKAARLRKEAEFLIEQEIKQLRQDLWRDAVNTAISAAGELLKDKITPDDQQRLAEDHLADLGLPKASSADEAPRAS
jgi:F-type H+-transporting ATPase subunit b